MKADVIFDFENAAWPALLVDGAGNIVRANQAALNTFGMALATSYPAKLGALWAPDNGLALEDFLKRGETALAPLTPLKLRLPAGPKVFLALASSPAGSERRLLLQLLPEGVAAGRSPAASENGLAHKQKLDCALQLARSVALDFNNALTSILGYTSLLLSRAEAAHPWRSTLIEVEKSAAKAAEVAADLAAFSLQEKENRTQTSGNLNAILQRCIEMFKDSQAERVIWSVSLERKLLAARFDEAKIQQAFMKVLENAVESVGPDGQVSLRSSNLELVTPTHDHNAKLAPGTYVCIEVADNGRGIEPEIMPRIFEPFFTTKKGTHRGLGLAWLYGIVTNHGGCVAVSSQPGAGASVRIYLPAEKGVLGENPETNADLSGTQTILLVDDEELLLRMGETILTSYGYRALIANSGQKALEIFSKNDQPVDLLITDLVMPLMSGRELVEQVRRVSPGTRILCMSGYVWPGSKQEKTPFLQKPFTTQDLLRKVKQTLAAPTT